MKAVHMYFNGKSKHYAIGDIVKLKSGSYTIATIVDNSGVIELRDATPTLFLTVTPASGLILELV